MKEPEVFTEVQQIKSTTTQSKHIMLAVRSLPEMLFITSFPPRECGIATYSQDLIKALDSKFDRSFKVVVCPLETETEQHTYISRPKYRLRADMATDYELLANQINGDKSIGAVLLQHEFGFFAGNEANLRYMLALLVKPIIIVFHTVLPKPDVSLKADVQDLAATAEELIVMTHAAANMLVTEYAIPREKISIIAHGTHLVPHADKVALKIKYGLADRKVLSTFGLLSSGKSMETTLDALPAIIKGAPSVMFLIIGKTHPSVVKHEGEQYREMLERKVVDLHLQQHVRFINAFLPLPDLLEYLQLTDIYLFTSKDPNQAVSGTFSYAISCGCPIVSTPIPHAREVLRNDAGLIVDFENCEQLAAAVNMLLHNDTQRKTISLNGLHRIAPTAWENAAIAHARLIEKWSDIPITLHYKVPPINLDHIKKLTTDFGMIQFSILNKPDINSGYTLDDNARALVAMCQHFQLTRDRDDLPYIKTYLSFVTFCLQADGAFQNYVNEKGQFSIQNKETNLSDANGRAVWALGYVLSLTDILPAIIVAGAEATMQQTLWRVTKMHSSRAMAFTIKGLYYRYTRLKLQSDLFLIRELANRLMQMYRHESDSEWQWFESYLTYGNSILPEAMLCAWQATGHKEYQLIAVASFNFLLAKTMTSSCIRLISNKKWLHKGDDQEAIAPGGEQPIDVAYTILALHRFHDVFRTKGYKAQMYRFFNWFLGENHLRQIIYNPCTGGCYDGLEEYTVNLNQGAESTVSYLMARLSIGLPTSIGMTINVRQSAALAEIKSKELV